MPKTTVLCSRCGKTVRGFESATATAGFYRRTPTWERYFKEGETILCDECMTTDPRYQAAFPKSWA